MNINLYPLQSNCADLKCSEIKIRSWNAVAKCSWRCEIVLEIVCLQGILPTTPAYSTADRVSGVKSVDLSQED